MFYYFVLRRLTFYNWNRWYLLVYSTLCFFIPFIDLSPSLSERSSTEIYHWVPMVEPSLSSITNVSGDDISYTDAMLVIFIAGVIIMLIRLFIQLLSFRKMVKKAKLLSSEVVNIYQVDEPVIPFSFGRSVFVNPSLHTTAELQEIILHEFIHVKQRHSADILFAEILCMLNWFNPFAWFIRSAIRQNLEFAADEQVIQNGVNKQAYQYLLLKVIGNNQFSIAQKFNFTSLKKRIAMMNKNKSASRHLLRFLFVLPVLSVILLSFRKELTLTVNNNPGKFSQTPFQVNDTLPEFSLNDKGYSVTIEDKKGESIVVVKDKKGKEVKRMLLTQWDANKQANRELYGDIQPPLPPLPPIPGNAPEAPLPPLPKLGEKSASAPRTGAEPTWGGSYSEYELTSTKAVFKTKDGKVESYDLTNPAEKASFEKKFGLVPEPMRPSLTVPPLPAKPVTPALPSKTPAPSHEAAGYIPSLNQQTLLTADELVTITITPSTTEAELEEYKKKMKARDVNLTYFDLIFHNGKLSKLTGKMESRSRKSDFSAIDFKQLTLGIGVEGDQVWAVVNVVRN